MVSAADRVIRERLCEIRGRGGARRREASNEAAAVEERHHFIPDRGVEAERRELEDAGFGA
jgi:hypothetical protein